MKHCEHCGRENPDDATVCQGCGSDDFGKPSGATASAEDAVITRLKLQFAPLDPANLGQDWVTLVRCQNLMEADVLASHLEAAEIPSFIPDEFAAQATPFNMTASAGVRIQVSPKDYDAAKQLLGSLNEDPPPDPADIG